MILERSVLVFMGGLPAIDQGSTVQVLWRLELRDRTIYTSLHDEETPLYRVEDIRATGIC